MADGKVDLTKEDRADQIAQWADEQWGADFAYGFRHGVDFCDEYTSNQYKPNPSATEDTIAGILAGIAVWKSLNTVDEEAKATVS